MTGEERSAADAFAAVARSLAQQQGLQPTLDRIVALAVETVPGAEHAAISLIRTRRTVESVAVTGDLPVRVDAVQYETGQGPCLDAIWEAETVRIDDLAATDRWPLFAQRAADLGVRSMLSCRLFVEDDTAGALNLYSAAAGGFDDDDAALGHVFAAHAALAYEHERELGGLRDAVDGRTLIGQAQGLLMAQQGVDADQAFALLRTASSHRNVKLRVLAQQVVDRGGLAP